MFLDISKLDFSPSLAGCRCPLQLDSHIFSISCYSPVFDGMAASVSSLGPPTIGPGNSAPTVYRRQPVNREPLSGNTLCHKVGLMLLVHSKNPGAVSKRQRYCRVSVNAKFC